MARSVEELKKDIDEKLEAIEERKKRLLDQKAKAIQREKERLAKEAKIETEIFRKYTTHMKVVLGGYILSKSRKTKNVSLLKEFAGTLINEKEREWIKRYIAGIPEIQQPAAAPKPAPEKTDKLPAK
jgi:hypothetical protein